MLPVVTDGQGIRRRIYDAKSTVIKIALGASDSGGRFVSQTQPHLLLTFIVSPSLPPK